MRYALLLILIGCGSDPGVAGNDPDAMEPDAPICTLPDLGCDVGIEWPSIPPRFRGEWEFVTDPGLCTPTTLRICIREHVAQLAEDPACGVSTAGIRQVLGDSLNAGGVDVTMCDGSERRVCAFGMNVASDGSTITDPYLYFGDCNGCDNAATGTATATKVSVDCPNFPP